jgi:hypothetical protein
MIFILLQLKRIEELVAKKALNQKINQDIDSKYNSIIASADSKYDNHKYKEAKLIYLSSLEVKPNEEYPRSQIRKSDERLRILAANKKAITKTFVVTADAKVDPLEFKSESERDKYFANLLSKYDAGVTLETYKEGKKTTKRYIIIRENQAHEFRSIIFSWGGSQYSIDGKPSSSLHFNKLVKPRMGEKFVEIEKQQD